MDENSKFPKQIVRYIDVENVFEFEKIEIRTRPILSPAPSYVIDPHLQFKSNYRFNHFLTFYFSISFVLPSLSFYKVVENLKRVTETNPKIKFQ